MKINLRNLFNTKIKIEGSKLIFKRSKYSVLDIVSIEKVEEPVLLALNKRHCGNPYTKGTLKSTKYFEISSIYNFEVNGSSVDYNEFISQLIERSENTNRSNEGWLPVRLLIPSAITQVFAIIIGFIIYQNFDKAITFAVISSLLVLPIGYIWEKKAHLKHINKNS